METKEWTAKVVAWLRRNISQYSPSFRYWRSLDTTMPVAKDPQRSLIPQEPARRRSHAGQGSRIFTKELSYIRL